jgi:hypothetical protein
MSDDKRTDDERSSEHLPPQVRTTDAPATPDPTTAGSAPDPEVKPDPRLKDPAGLDPRPDLADPA